MEVSGSDQRRSIIFNRYTVALSLVTTLALGALKHARPNSISWRWPASTGAATLCLWACLPQAKSEAQKDTVNSSPKGQKKEKARPELDPKAVVKEQLETHLKEKGLELDSFNQQLEDFNLQLSAAKSFDQAHNSAQAHDLWKKGRDVNLKQLRQYSQSLHEAYEDYLSAVEFVEAYAEKPSNCILARPFHSRFTQLLDLDRQYALELFVAIPESPVATSSNQKKLVMEAILKWAASPERGIAPLQRSSHWNELMLTAFRLDCMDVNPDFKELVEPYLFTTVITHVPGGTLIACYLKSDRAKELAAVMAKQKE